MWTYLGHSPGLSSTEPLGVLSLECLDLEASWPGLIWFSIFMILPPTKSFPFLASTLRLDVNPDIGSRASSKVVKSSWRQVESPSIGNGVEVPCQVIGHSERLLRRLVQLTQNRGTGAGLEEEAQADCCFYGSRAICCSRCSLLLRDLPSPVCPLAGWHPRRFPWELQQRGAHSLFLSSAASVALGVGTSEPQFPPLYNGCDDTHACGTVGRMRWWEGGIFKEQYCEIVSRCH